MEHVYNANGLPFWGEQEILTRNYLIESFAGQVKHILLSANKAWSFHRIESPCLIPQELINSEYTEEQVFVTSNSFVLKPETTPASYAYAEKLLGSQQILPPFVVWQASKSFRREQDQATKNMRLKEFYQQEFQCIFTEDTKNDYFSYCLEFLREAILTHLCLDTRIVESDRLPSYSLKTMDIEVLSKDKWMEVVSISLRKDVPFKVRFKDQEKSLLNLEIAIGLDRCVYNKLRLFNNV